MGAKDGWLDLRGRRSYILLDIDVERSVTLRDLRLQSLAVLVKKVVFQC